jgi:hypothetical protein
VKGILFLLALYIPSPNVVIHDRRLMVVPLLLAAALLFLGQNHIDEYIDIGRIRLRFGFFGPLYIFGVTLYVYLTSRRA